MPVAAVVHTITSSHHTAFGDRSVVHPVASRYAAHAGGKRQGYAVSAFTVDWEARTVTCPQGHRSVDWVVNHDPWGTGTVHVGFAKATCRACPSRPLCTRAKAAPRALTLRREGRHEAIQAMRKRQ